MCRIDGQTGKASGVQRAAAGLCGRSCQRRASTLSQRQPRPAVAPSGQHCGGATASHICPAQAKGRGHRCAVWPGRRAAVWKHCICPYTAEAALGVLQQVPTFILFSFYPFLIISYLIISLYPFSYVLVSFLLLFICASFHHIFARVESLPFRSKLDTSRDSLCCPWRTTV